MTVVSPGRWRVEVWGDLDGRARLSWGSLCSPSFYLTAEWLKARSAQLRAVPHFVIVHHAGRPVLAFPAYTVTPGSHRAYDPAWLIEHAATTSIRDGRVAGSDRAELRRALDVVRAARPAMVPAVVAAAPGHSGGAAVAPHMSEAIEEQAVQLGADALERTAAEGKAGLAAWLFVNPAERPTIAEATSALGYRSFVTDAECHLPIRWGSFEGYLAHLNSLRRRNVRLEMDRFRRASVVVEMRGADGLDEELARLEAAWRAKHGRPVPVSEIEDLYARLRQELSGKIVLFVGARQGRTIGFTAFFEHAHVWYSRFGGFDYGAGRFFSYFNLLFYEPIREAIARGISSIRYSTGAHETKRLRGCLLEERLMVVRLPDAVAGTMGPVLELVDRVQRQRFARIAAVHVEAAPPVIHSSR